MRVPSVDVASADAERLRSLYSDHAGPLLGYVLKLTDGDRGRAEDVVQETFLRAWQHAEAFAPERGSPRAWLCTVARNIVVDQARARRSRPREVGDEGLALGIAREAVVEDDHDRILLGWEVAEAMATLSPDHRAVLRETYFKGLSVAEAAEVLGIPPGTVKSRTYYALRALADRFRGTGDQTVNREPDALSGTCDNEDLQDRRRRPRAGRAGPGRGARGAPAPGRLPRVPGGVRLVRRGEAGHGHRAGRGADAGGHGAGADAPALGEALVAGSPTPAPFRAPRRRRVLTGATGFAAAFALIIGGFWAGHSGRPGTPTAGWEKLSSVSQAGVTAQISYQEHSWGTSVSTEVSGTPAGLNCTLYVVDKSQAMVPLSNWRSVAGKTIDIPAATSLPATQIDHFEVRVVGYGGYDITVPMTS